MNRYFHSKKISSTDTQRGFTLVELMVSLSLFIIVVLALITSLYTVNGASRRVQSMRVVMDNLNFATESISRTVRTGDHLICGGVAYASSPNCPLLGDPADGQSEAFSVHSTLGERQLVEYRWIERAGKGVVEKRSTGIGLGGAPQTGTTDWIAITAPEIDVESFHLYVDGALPDDGVHPYAIMKIEGIATAGVDNVAPFAIQTYLSQRGAE